MFKRLRENGSKDIRLDHVRRPGAWNAPFASLLVPLGGAGHPASVIGRVFYLQINLF